MESSLQDLIAIFLPQVTVITGALIILSTIYDPTMTVFLYSMLPQSYKTWPWFFACLFEELRLMTVMAAIAVPALQTQVIAFEFVNTRLQNVVCNTTKRYFLLVALERDQIKT